ncbi:ROK family protein [Virgisporangium aliadipatigenens]|nr:ROK family protein [Virgisporangium aliadipatigenens]
MVSMPGVEAVVAVLRAVSTGEAPSRAAVSRHLGAARSTVGLTVDYLLDQQLLVERALHDGRRGRPIQALALGPKAPLGGLIEFGPYRTIVAVSDLSGAILARHSVRTALACGPQEAIDGAALAMDELMDRLASPGSRITQVVASIGAPVNVGAGSVARSNNRSRAVPFPSLGWEEYPAATYLSQVFGTPAVLENDVHLLAIGDAAGLERDRFPLIRLHASMGLGAGILTDQGDLVRGVSGLAGDVGHLVVDGSSERSCWCGKSGCLSNVASIYSIGKDLGLPFGSEAGSDLVQTLRELVATGDEAAIRRIRDAADVVGRLAAILVDVINPGRLVLSGELIHLSSDVLARVRTGVYERSLPLSSRHLQVTVSTKDADGALPGAAQLAASLMLAPSGIDRVLRGGRPPA